MQHNLKRSVRSALAVAILFGLAACNDESVIPLPTAAGTEPSADLLSSQRAEQAVARLLAAALRNPQVRAELKQAL